MNKEIWKYNWTQHLDSVQDFTSSIDGIRVSRDMKNSDIERFQNEVQELNQRFQIMQAENLQKNMGTWLSACGKFTLCYLCDLSWSILHLSCVGIYEKQLATGKEEKNPQCAAKFISDTFYVHPIMELEFHIILSLWVSSD